MVVDVVCRSYLQTSGTELDIHISILDDRNATAHQRNNHTLALQPGVLRVLRIDTHRSITHDGFRTCGSYHGITSASVRLTVLVGHHISQIIQLAVLFLIDNFLVRKGSQCLRVPVHHAHTAVNESLVIQVAEHLDDALAADFIHRKAGAVPVTAGTQLAQLLQNDTSVLLGPCPGMLQELLTGQVSLLDSLCGQTVHHLGLSGNRSVVGTRHPAGILAFHAGAAHQNILNGIVQNVSHVQHTGYVWRWDYHGIWLAAIGLRAEQLVVKPILIPFFLYICRIVLTC